ncbi:alpha/beta hydrolase [Catenulispora yoronensis]|uniref:Alpha/beta hydrolase n=1 Tax=Catenulispora yoronensis TaxID=450799 RepID=A0ABN2TTR1_9ACTN
MASKESLRVDRYWRTVRQATMNPQPDDLVTNSQWDVLTAEPRGVDYLEVDADGVPALWLLPHGVAEDAPVLLCIHGGGYVGGSMFTHRKMFAHLAKAIGARALAIDYKLVFQGGTFPTPVVEGLTAYQWLLDQGVPATRVMFAGDSAGGQLSVTVQLRARAEGLPLPAGAMLISPWTDLEVTGESMVSNDGNDALFSKQWIVDMVAAFLDGTDPRSPEASPVQADLTGFGPLYIQVGDQELLLDDSRIFAKHAEQAGVDVRLDVFADQQHTFQMAAGLAPEADEAIERLAAWARPKLGLG